MYNINNTEIYRTYHLFHFCFILYFSGYLFYVSFMAQDLSNEENKNELPKISNYSYSTEMKLKTLAIKADQRDDEIHKGSLLINIFFI